MSDRRLSPHCLYIHPPSVPAPSGGPKQHAPFAEQSPPALWPPCPPRLHHHLALVPPALLLHPFLHPPLPTVIVSPHSLSPPPQRDSARTLSKKPPAKPAQAHPDSTDGNKGPRRSVPTSAPTMTANALPAAASKRADAATQMRPQRPSLVSQHSNSVPSTPMQVPRRYETRSRSPSPNGGLGSHSPRSVASEANSAMPSLRQARPFKCKFETNVGMLGRRRVPYQSDELLAQATEELKTTLDPHEDDKLSGDMRELYDRLQPTQADTEVREKFVKKVQRILETEFPGIEMKFHVFGSSGNMLWTAESDGTTSDF